MDWLSTMEKTTGNKLEGRRSMQSKVLSGCLVVKNAPKHEVAQELFMNYANQGLDFENLKG